MKDNAEELFNHLHEQLEDRDFAKRMRNFSQESVGMFAEASMDLSDEGLDAENIFTFSELGKGGHATVTLVFPDEEHDLNLMAEASDPEFDILASGLQGDWKFSKKEGELSDPQKEEVEKAFDYLIESIDDFLKAVERRTR